MNFRADARLLKVFQIFPDKQTLGLFAQQLYSIRKMSASRLAVHLIKWFNWNQVIANIANISIYVYRICSNCDSNQFRVTNEVKHWKALVFLQIYKLRFSTQLVIRTLLLFSHQMMQFLIAISFLLHFPQTFPMKVGRFEIVGAKIVLLVSARKRFGKLSAWTSTALHSMHWICWTPC